MSDPALFSPAWWTQPIWPGFWMAWTWATVAFCVLIFSSIALMGLLEFRRAGGAPRDGILGLRTTRGDRLFISLLGSAYVLLAWLGFVGQPIWGGVALAAAWTGFVYYKV